MLLFQRVGKLGLLPLLSVEQGFCARARMTPSSGSAAVMLVALFKRVGVGVRGEGRGMRSYSLRTPHPSPLTPKYRKSENNT